MSFEVVRNAALALEAAGTDVSIRTLQQALPGVGRSTIGRHLATLRAEREEGEASGGDVATAVLEPPDVRTTAPDTDQAVQQAQAALEAARAHLAAAERSPALAMRLSLVTAQRGGIIPRDDPCWNDFDHATRLVASATEAVEDATEALKAADRRHQGQLRAQAEAAYAQTARGKAILEEIDRLKRLYDDAAAREVGSVASYSDALARERSRFNAGVSAVVATMQPAVPAVPSGPPPRLSVEVLKTCYVHDGIGRVLPAGLTRFEYEDYGVLMQTRETLREELMAANRTYRDLEGNDELRGLAWHDPRGKDMHEARRLTGTLQLAVQLISQDLQVLQRRARDTGQYL